MQVKNANEMRASDIEYATVREKLIRVFAAAARRMERALNENNLPLLEYRECARGIAILTESGHKTTRSRWWFATPIHMFLDEKSPDYENQVNTLKALRISRLGGFLRSALPMMRTTFRAHGTKLPVSLEILHSEFHHSEFQA